MIDQESGDVERKLDCPVYLRDFASIACAHRPHKTVTRYGENVVEIGNTLHRKSLLATQDHLGGKLADRPCYDHDDDASDAIDDGIPGEDHHGSVADWRGQLGPPDLSAFHARSAFHAEMSGSSGNSTVCAFATSAGSRSVIAMDSAYCWIASSTSTRTSRPVFAASTRTCASATLVNSMLMPPMYSRAHLASTAGSGRVRTMQRTARATASPHSELTAFLVVRVKKLTSASTQASRSDATDAGHPSFRRHSDECRDTHLSGGGGDFASTWVSG